MNAGQEDILLIKSLHKRQLGRILELSFTNFYLHLRHFRKNKQPHHQFKIIPFKRTTKVRISGDASNQATQGLAIALKIVCISRYMLINLGVQDIQGKN